MLKLTKQAIINNGDILKNDIKSLQKNHNTVVYDEFDNLDDLLEKVNNELSEFYHQIDNGEITEDEIFLNKYILKDLKTEIEISEGKDGIFVEIDGKELPENPFSYIDDVNVSLLTKYIVLKEYGKKTIRNIISTIIEELHANNDISGMGDIIGMDYTIDMIKLVLKDNNILEKHGLLYDYIDTLEDIIAYNVGTLQEAINYMQEENIDQVVIEDKISFKELFVLKKDNKFNKLAILEPSGKEIDFVDTSIEENIDAQINELVYIISKHKPELLYEFGYSFKKDPVKPTKQTKINYNKILTKEVKEHVRNSIIAGIDEGATKPEDITLDYDRFISLFIDTLSNEEYQVFDREKAENTIYEYMTKQFDKIKKELEEENEEKEPEEPVGLSIKDFKKVMEVVKTFYDKRSVDPLEPVVLDLENGVLKTKSFILEGLNFGRGKIYTIDNKLGSKGICTMGQGQIYLDITTLYYLYNSLSKNKEPYLNIAFGNKHKYVIYLTAKEGKKDYIFNQLEDKNITLPITELQDKIQINKEEFENYVMPYKELLKNSEILDKIYVYETDNKVHAMSGTNGYAMVSFRDYPNDLEQYPAVISRNILNTVAKLDKKIGISEIYFGKNDTNKDKPIYHIKLKNGWIVEIVDHPSDTKNPVHKARARGYEELISSNGVHNLSLADKDVMKRHLDKGYLFEIDSKNIKELKENINNMKISQKDRFDDNLKKSIKVIDENTLQIGSYKYNIETINNVYTNIDYWVNILDFKNVLNIIPIQDYTCYFEYKHGFLFMRGGQKQEVYVLMRLYD